MKIKKNTSTANKKKIKAPSASNHNCSHICLSFCHPSVISQALWTKINFWSKKQQNEVSKYHDNFSNPPSNITSYPRLCLCSLPFLYTKLLIIL